MADKEPPQQNEQNGTKSRRRLPNELLAELCHSVVPRLGIWDDAGRSPPRHNANILTASAALCVFLRHKFRQRKAIEIEQREKCCQICAQLAWGAYKLGPIGKICIGCKCFFVRCLRDKNFVAGGAPCTCSGRRADETGPKMCKSCRLNKCEQIGLSKAMALCGNSGSSGNSGSNGNRKRRTAEQTA
ncbi:hypothetical protein niasHS_001600 [Heterodera schachtii]|uniref:Nuclear receptor domain-containing protein n=1 Tax=Heterodera schachtii TaxID=97005 RepID=A0ABD2KEQ5_HETSC